VTPRITRVRVYDAGVAATLVEVDAGDLAGIGLTQSPSFAVEPIIQHPRWGLARMLVGEEVGPAESFWIAMTQGFGAQRGRGVEGGIAVNAAAALDMALWDLHGKAAGEAVHALLGGAKHRTVMAYASATAVLSSSYESGGEWIFKDPGQLASESRKYVDQGFKAVKFGWGNRFGADDEARLAAVRDALGPETRLMVDFGCPAYWDPGWSLFEAQRVARMLERYDVYFFEEPLAPHAGYDFKRLSSATRTRIATGESLCLEPEFSALIDSRSVAVIQPDAAQIGITLTSRVARHADAEGILCVPHSPWSALTVASHAQILSTLDQESMVEYPAMASFEKGSTHGAATAFHNFELVEHPPVLRDGRVQITDAPGLGLGGFVGDALGRLAKHRS
jgi:L-alanine-DL-glutamate epimerase-like enolase superfamily enzyme